MNRFYSKKMLWPFSGVVQVVELGWGRALSLDGRHWAIRYAEHEDVQTRNGPLSYDPRINCSMVVTINGEQLKTRADPDLSREQVQADSQKLFAALRDQAVPFAPADLYEYWLLDGQDQRPLALLYSCVEAQEMQQPAPPPEWRALPAAELAIVDPLSTATGIPPVNYRLERLVNARAGNKPQATWFHRAEADAGDFPDLLLREDWPDEEARRLCELYLRRMAPRLLMLADLPAAKRQWLEQAARENAFDVDRFYGIYPQEVDRSFINAARVEARMLQAAEV